MQAQQKLCSSLSPICLKQSHSKSSPKTNKHCILNAGYLYQGGNGKVCFKRNQVSDILNLIFKHFKFTAQFSARAGKGG